MSSGNGVEVREVLLNELRQAISINFSEARKVLAERSETHKDVYGFIFQRIMDDYMIKYSHGSKISELPIRELIELILWSCETGYIDIVPVFLVFEDMFNAFTITDCCIAFEVLESNHKKIAEQLSISTKKSSWGELTMLRFCNELLRRVSKCSHVEFSGRVLCFLADMLELTARSGVNTASLVNESNTTEYELDETSTSQLDPSSNDKKDEKEEKEEEKEEGEAIDEDENNYNSTNENTKQPIIDFVFYQTLWGLQKYLHKAELAQDEQNWKEITRSINTVVSSFSTFCKDGQTKSATQPFYSTKYLSSSALLKLQLSDSGFRQQILVQISVFLHSISNKIKDKGPHINDSKLNWVEETQSKVRKILSQTGHNGKQVSKILKHLLSRELNWIAWKGAEPKVCPPFERYWQGGEFAISNMIQQITKTIPAKPEFGIGGTMKARGRAAKVVNISKAEIDAHIIDPSRVNIKWTIPEVLKIVENEEDPSQMIEAVYKKANNDIVSWRTKRLIAESDMLMIPSVIENGLVGAVEYLKTQNSNSNSNSNSNPNPNSTTEKKVESEPNSSNKNETTKKEVINETSGENSPLKSTNEKSVLKRMRSSDTIQPSKKIAPAK